jgi:hypothetical protein
MGLNIFLDASLFRASYRIGQVVWNQRISLTGKSLCGRLFGMA